MKSFEEIQKACSSNKVKFLIWLVCYFKNLIKQAKEKTSRYFTCWRGTRRKKGHKTEKFSLLQDTEIYLAKSVSLTVEKICFL